MNEDINSRFSNDEWLDYFSTISNHWVLRYWSNNKREFFHRFVIINETAAFVIGDKEEYCFYEFKKPSKEITIQLNLEI